MIWDRCSNILPFAIGPMLLGAHQATRLMWTFWRILETVDGHSGYALPWSMFNLTNGVVGFGARYSGAEWHDWHHRCGANFCIFVCVSLLWECLGRLTRRCMRLPTHRTFKDNYGAQYMDNLCGTAADMTRDDGDDDAKEQ